MVDWNDETTRPTTEIECFCPGCGYCYFRIDTAKALANYGDFIQRKEQALKNHLSEYHGVEGTA